MDNNIIGIGIALGISFLSLYTRKKAWMKPKIVWLICIVLFTIGWFNFSHSEFRNDKIMYFGFCVPLIYWTFDRIFKQISERIHKRDFILFLQGSEEINDGFRAKNPHVKISDKLFSFGLLIIIIGTLLIGIQMI